MGLSHAVFLVQVLHEWILRGVERMQTAAVPREWGLRPLAAKLSMLAGVIVDDLYIVGLNGPAEVDALLAEAEPVYLKHGWVAKESKREPAALEGRKVVGVDVDGRALCLRPPLRLVFLERQVALIAARSCLGRLLLLFAWG